MTPASAPAAPDTSRWIVGSALAIITLIAWWLLWQSTIAMQRMSGDGPLLQLMMAMMSPTAARAYLAAAGVMWLVMMIAMMSPALLSCLRVFMRLDRGSGRLPHAALFGAGYFFAWLLFAVLATALQWGLHRAGWLLDPALAGRPLLAAAILIVAGGYQLTPFKEACLRQCQSPLGFLLGHWRDGAGGALRMGVQHGFYCLGCCWALMAVMFAGGVMSLPTMIAISLVILVERLSSPTRWVRLLPGGVLIGWGVLVLATVWSE